MTNFRCLLVAGLALGMLAGVTHAQNTPASRCYSFDRAYFRWSYWSRERRVQVTDSTRVVELAPDSASWNSRFIGRRLLPIPAIPDSEGWNRWARSSIWELRTPDSLRVTWHDGFHGTRLELAGTDTLRGMAHVLSDATFIDSSGRPIRPAPQPAFAVRVTCAR